MTRDTVTRLVADALDGQPGWEKVPAGPSTREHFRHAEARVRIFVYEAEVTVVFGRGVDDLYEQAVSARTAYYPRLAVSSAVRVATALVATSVPAAGGDG